MIEEDDQYPSSSSVPTSPKLANVRRFWERTSYHSKKWYSRNDLFGEMLLDGGGPLRYEYRSNAGFSHFFRMSSLEFERLLNMIGPKISKKETDLRRALPIHERLGLTLRFLASGDSVHSLMYSFKISKQVISYVIPEICEALVESLQDFVKIPKNDTDWKKLAILFNKKWNFPNCVGVIDGKQITLQAPTKRSTEFYNCKGFFRIVIFSIIDSDYNFVYANVICQSRISDGGMFRQNEYKRVLEETTSNLPANSTLPDRSVAIPFVYLGDDAFPLMPNVMKPFPGPHSKMSRRKTFNFRLSRGRRVSENVFGILSTIFRILKTPMLLQPETAKKVILAIIYLHNFLRKSPSKNVYNPPGSFDQECQTSGEFVPGVWRQDKPGGFSTFATVPRRSTILAESVRNQFMDYFSSPEGRLS